MVHPQLEPPSSPTPNLSNPNIPSLIPSPPPQPRNQLLHGSSSRPGHVTASGLAAWRRGTKLSYTQNHNGKGSQKKDITIGKKEGSSSGKLGVGMGMQGTPARKKKARTNTHSIGSHSTPKASTRPPTRSSKHNTTTAAPQSTSSSIPISSLPSFDDLTSDEFTRPHLSLEDKVFAAMRKGLGEMSSDVASNGTGEEGDGDGDITTRQDDGLVMVMGDEMVVPLNDFTETTIRQSCNSTTPTVIRPDVQPSDGPAPSKPEACLLNIHDEGTTHWDYMTSIYFPPENTTIQQVKALSPTLNEFSIEFSIPVVCHSREDRRTPSKATSKIRERQSTPYKRPVTTLNINEDTATNDDDDLDVELPRTVYTPRNRSPVYNRKGQGKNSLSPILRSIEVPVNLDVFSIAPEDQWMDDDPDRLENEVVNSSPTRESDSAVGATGAKIANELDEMEDFDPGMEMDVDYDYPPLSPMDQGDIEEVEAENRGSIREKDSPTPLTEDGSGESNDTEGWAGERDFGFARVQEICKIVRPQPFVPSSQVPSSNPPSPTSSIIIFSPTPSITASSESTVIDPSTPVENLGGKVPQRWQGAITLARMQEGVRAPEDDEDVDHETDTQRRSIKDRKGLGGRKRKSRAESIGGGCELSVVSGV